MFHSFDTIPSIMSYRPARHNLIIIARRRRLQCHCYLELPPDALGTSRRSALV